MPIIYESSRYLFENQNVVRGQKGSSGRKRDFCSYILTHGQRSLSIFGNLWTTLVVCLSLELQIYARHVNPCAINRLEFLVLLPY
jgi:hypothetical protein